MYLMKLVIFSLRASSYVFRDEQEMRLNITAGTRRYLMHLSCSPHYPIFL